MSIVREVWPGAETPYEGQNVSNANAIIGISPHLKPRKEALTNEDFCVGNHAIMVECAHDLPGMVRKKNSIRKKGAVNSLSTRPHVFSNFNMWVRDKDNFELRKIPYPGNPGKSQQIVLIAKTKEAAHKIVALRFSGVSRAAVRKNGIAGNRNADIAIQKIGVVNVHVALQDLINCENGFYCGQPMSLNINIPRWGNQGIKNPDDNKYDRDKDDPQKLYYIGLCPIKFKNEPDYYWRAGVRRSKVNDYHMGWVIGNVRMVGEAGQNYAYTELTETPRLVYTGPNKKHKLSNSLHSGAGTATYSSMAPVDDDESEEAVPEPAPKKKKRSTPTTAPTTTEAVVTSRSGGLTNSSMTSVDTDESAEAVSGLTSKKKKRSTPATVSATTEAVVTSRSGGTTRVSLQRGA